MIPSIDVVTPALGSSQGGELITVRGEGFRLPPVPASGPVGALRETVRVYLGGELATEVLVRPDESNPPNGTMFDCVTPPFRGNPSSFDTPSFAASVDLLVQNIGDDGLPIVGEEAVVLGGWSYKRPSLVAEGNLARLVRQVIRDLRNQVIDNVSLTTSADFASPEAPEITALSKIPALIITGPVLLKSEYSHADQEEDTLDGGDIGLRNSIVTRDLSFTIFGIHDHGKLAINFLQVVNSFFASNPWLYLVRVPESPDLGRVRYEMALIEELEFLSQPSDDNLNVFRGVFVIRGFDVHQGKTVEVTRPIETEELELQLF